VGTQLPNVLLEALVARFVFSYPLDLGAVSSVELRLTEGDRLANLPWREDPLAIFNRHEKVVRLGHFLVSDISRYRAQKLLNTKMYWGCSRMNLK
jgi:hypothetical protein